MDQPFMLMIAGPNGSGKTTLTRWLRQRSVDFGEYINPDDIAEGLVGLPEERTIKAQTIADQRRDECIKARRSFSFETVMSHPSKIDILARARDAGFFVQLFFVGTDDPQTNIDRVQLRVAQGGHDVPKEKIVARWKRTMESLSDAIRSSDQAFVFDNSTAGTVVTAPRLVFRRSPTKEGHRPFSEHYPPVPNWVDRYVLNPLGIGFPNVYSASAETFVRQSIVSLPNIGRPSVDQKVPERLDSISSGEFGSLSRPVATAIDSAVQAYVDLGTSNTLSIGLGDLDRRLGRGLQPSDLVIIAAQPGLGKTALATNIAYNVASSWRAEVKADGSVARDAGGMVGFFSLEMTAEQIATRVICMKSGIPSDRILNGRISEAEFERVIEVAKEIESIPLFILDTAGLSISQLEIRAEQLKKLRGLDLIVIDTIQLLQRETGRAAGSSLTRASTISTALKALAKRINVPVIAVSQLAKPRSVRMRRPQLSDLDQAFEQDADIVLFLYREDYYLAGEEPVPGTYAHMEWQTQMSIAWGAAEIIIAKNRHGPTGTIQLQFDAQISRFSDLART